MSESPYDLDQLDRQIIDMLQEDPDVDESDISEVVGKSEAIVGNRILKLERRGIIGHQIGINVKDSDVAVALVQFSTKNSAVIMDKMKNCPFLVNAFRKTGKYDLMAIFAADNPKNLENMLNHCYRSDKRIKKMETSYLFSALKDFIIPVHLNLPDVVGVGCPFRCNISEDESERLKELVKTTRKERISTKILPSIEHETVLEAQ